MFTVYRKHAHPWVYFTAAYVMSMSFEIGCVSSRSQVASVSYGSHLTTCLFSACVHQLWLSWKAKQIRCKLPWRNWSWYYHYVEHSVLYFSIDSFFHFISLIVFFFILFYFIYIYCIKFVNKYLLISHNKRCNESKWKLTAYLRLARK